jgi:hypothetical protein
LGEAISESLRPRAVQRRWAHSVRPFSMAVVLAAGIVLSAAGEAAHAAPVSTAPSTIASDCSKDVTAALNSWAAAQPDGTVLQLASGGCYQVDGSFTLTNRNQITLDGNGATMQAMTGGSSVRPLVAVVGGAGDTVENVTLIGANPKPKYSSSHEWQPGIKLGGTTGATVTNVTIQDVYGDFVLVTSNGKLPSSHITIENSHFDTAGRQGIAIVDADTVDVNNVSLGNTASDTFDLESNTASQATSNVTIENTTSFGTGKVWFSAGGNGVGQGGNVTVNNNTMTTTQAGDVINIWSPSNTTKGPFMFSNDTLYAGASKSVAALQLTRTSNLTLANSTIYFANYGKSSKFTHETAEYLYKSVNIATQDDTFVGPGKMMDSHGSTSSSSGDVVEQ